MKVKAVKSFGGVTRTSRFHVSEGSVFELPEGSDWLRAGLVVEVKDKNPVMKKEPGFGGQTAMMEAGKGRAAPPPLSAVKGLGAGRVAALEGLGIWSIPDLVAADADVVAAGLRGVGVATVVGWQADGREILGKL